MNGYVDSSADWVSRKSKEKIENKESSSVSLSSETVRQVLDLYNVVYIFSNCTNPQPAEAENCNKFLARGGFPQSNIRLPKLRDYVCMSVCVYVIMCVCMCECANCLISGYLS